MGFGVVTSCWCLKKKRVEGTVVDDTNPDQIHSHLIWLLKTETSFLTGIFRGRDILDEEDEAGVLLYVFSVSLLVTLWPWALGVSRILTFRSSSSGLRGKVVYVAKWAPFSKAESIETLELVNWTGM